VSELPLIDIACIADGRYFRHAGAMLHSVLSHTRDARVRVHVLHEREVPADDARHMETMIRALGAELVWLTLPASRTASFPNGAYLPRAVWFRVLLPELLPQLERILYIDSDIIGADSLHELWQTELGEHVFGAVTNPMYPFMAPYAAPKLGIEDPAEYLNSGVLLMNLTQMRAEGIIEKITRYAHDFPDRQDYADQDAFNVVCKGRWLHLHPRWNAQSTLFQLADDELPLPAAQVHEARARPALIHYIGPFKPWTYMCTHPLQHLYLEHAAATPWGAPALEGRTLRTRLLRPLPLGTLDRVLTLEAKLKRRWRRWFG
jgi:lipopolysaccharide biosynthesis glycosyltransferase